ncbi:MAG: hypothetical protein J6S02_08010, partial [Bacteroidaceae bacterium]|nr:hypothetical protein [Bacteroidaceae bacterium]
MKTHRCILALALLLATANSLVAQQAEPVRAVIISGQDSAWYARQAEAWEAEVKKHPKSEEAWRNLFNAKYYLKFWFDGLKEHTPVENFVMTRIEQAIPETFTYNYCRYRISMTSDSVF